jgi:hypothetical protein
MQENVEHQLIESLQPIRYHVLATQIYHFFNEGIYDKLLESDHSQELISTVIQHFRLL